MPASLPQDNEPAAQPGAGARATQGAMGTVMTHSVYGVHNEACLAAVCREIERIEGLLSRHIPTSDISRINATAGVRSVKVSPDTFAVLSQAVEFSRACPGCFDVTIAPLVRLWNKARQTQSSPDEASIRQALALVNYQDLILDPQQLTAGLRYPGQAIDLGGIGKGFAGDRILEIFRSYESPSAYSNLGGNVVTWGAKPDGSAWQVGIQHPRQEDRLAGAVAVIDQTVVTSGDYQRYFIDHQGKRRHHILDPRTGYPAETGLISVSIVADNSLAADALSTILFIAGMEQGLQLLKGFPRTEAILVDTHLRVFITQGLKNRFQADTDIAVTLLG